MPIWLAPAEDVCDACASSSFPLNLLCMAPCAIMFVNLMSVDFVFVCISAFFFLVHILFAHLECRLTRHCGVKDMSLFSNIVALRMCAQILRVLLRY